MDTGILKEKQLRATPFRKKVLEIFLKNDHAISAQDIEEELGEFDRITLYRTIKAFVKNGVIHEIALPGEVKRMALCDPICNHDDGLHEHNHVHFQCRQCDEVYCVEVDELPDVSLKGFKVEEVEVQAKGICQHCQ
ncbi:MAG: Fur family transcriptional regulator [Bacteroidota bacterium]